MTMNPDEAKGGTAIYFIRGVVSILSACKWLSVRSVVLPAAVKDGRDV